MKFPTHIAWTCPFPFLGFLGGIFPFDSNSNRTFCKQTVENLIRRCNLWRLVWFCTVCLCPTKRTLGWNGLIQTNKQICLFYHSLLEEKLQEKQKIFKTELYQITKDPTYRYAHPLSLNYNLSWAVIHKEHQKLVFSTNYCLMQVNGIAEYSKGSILQYFRSSLSYTFPLRP